MRAVQFAEYGDPEVLHVASAPEPHAGPGQVRIRVRAVGVNPLDWKIRGGMMRDFIPVELPAVTASDVSGEVDEVGDGVEGVAPGDAVFGFAVGGGAADLAVLEHWARKPDAMAFTEAAGYPVAVETAVRVLDLLAPEPGQVVLVNGAAGGVGIALVQLARERGARVIGTAGERNHEFLRGVGAEPVVYGDGVAERVRALAPGGADRVADAAGQGPLAELVEVAGGPENVVTIADFSAPQHGVRVTTAADERAWGALEEAARLHAEGRFSIPVEATFRFEEAADAHRLSQGGHVRGKVILVPGD